VNMVAGSGGQSSTRMSMDAPIQSSAGQTDVRVSGQGGHGPADIHHTTVDVYGRVVGSPPPPSMRPAIPNLQQQNQRVREQVDVNIHADTRPPVGGTVSRISMEVPVQAHTSSGPVDMRVSGSGSGSGSMDVTQQQTVDVYERIVAANSANNSGA